MTHTNEHGQPIGFPVVDWDTALVPNRDPMSGLYTRIVGVSNVEPCADLFRAYQSDTKGVNWTYLPYGPFAQEADFTRWFEHTCFNDDPLFHVIRSTGEHQATGVDAGVAVGLASYLRIQPGAGSIEVGHIHFSPLLQRTPMATEAMFLMMARVFDELNYRRYEWKCDALNKPSMCAAERLGFIYEGVFRQALTYKQRNRDTAWFSITDKEWPAIKAGFERWLSPENFDNQGRQRQSLQACRAK